MVGITRSKPIEFKLYAPQAKKVSVAGSFNKWNPKDVSAKKDSQGNWTAKVSLKPGKWEYKFVVDGNWVNDPRSPSTTGNAFGTQNSVLETK